MLIIEPYFLHKYGILITLLSSASVSIKFVIKFENRFQSPDNKGDLFLFKVIQAIKSYKITPAAISSSIFLRS